MHDVAPDWIDVDPARFNQQKRTIHNGVEITIGMSPNDLPDGVRGYYSDDHDLFIVELRYLNDEEERICEFPKEHVSFVVGKHSHRLYELRVDVRAIGANSVELKVVIPEEVERAFEQFARSRRNDPKFRNYVAAGKVLADRREELLSGV